MVQNAENHGKSHHPHQTKQQPMEISVQQSGRKYLHKNNTPLSAHSSPDSINVSDSVHHPHSARADRTCKVPTTRGNNSKMDSEADVIIIDREDDDETPVIRVDLTIDDCDLGPMQTDPSSIEEKPGKQTTNSSTGDPKDKENITMKRKHTESDVASRPKKYPKKRKKKKDIFVVKDVEVFCGTRSWSKRNHAIEEKMEVSDGEITEWANSSDSDNDDDDHKGENEQENKEKICMNNNDLHMTKHKNEIEGSEISGPADKTNLSKRDNELHMTEHKDEIDGGESAGLADQLKEDNETEEKESDSIGLDDEEKKDVIDLDEETEFKNEEKEDDVIIVDDDDADDDADDDVNDDHDDHEEHEYSSDDETFTETDEEDEEDTDIIGKDSTLVDCPKCYRRFTSESKYKAHMLSHFAEKAFQCLVCLRAFSSQWNLKRHIARAHKENYQCAICYGTFTSQWNLKRHTVRMHQKGWKACSVCKFRCETQSEMDLHIRTCHHVIRNSRHNQGNKISRNNVRQYSRTGVQFRLSCTSCSAKFRDAAGLAFHKRMCNEKKNTSVTQIGSGKYLNL